MLVLMPVLLLLAVLLLLRRQIGLRVVDDLRGCRLVLLCHRFLLPLLDVRIIPPLGGDFPGGDISVHAVRSRLGDIAAEGECFAQLGQAEPGHSARRHAAPLLAVILDELPGSLHEAGLALLACRLAGFHVRTSVHRPGLPASPDRPAAADRECGSDGRFGSAAAPGRRRGLAGPTAASPGRASWQRRRTESTRRTAPPPPRPPRPVRVRGSLPRG